MDTRERSIADRAVARIRRLSPATRLALSSDLVEAIKRYERRAGLEPRTASVRQRIHRLHRRLLSPRHYSVVLIRKQLVDLSAFSDVATVWLGFDDQRELAAYAKELRPQGLADLIERVEVAREFSGRHRDGGGRPYDAAALNLVRALARAFAEHVGRPTHGWNDKRGGGYWSEFSIYCFEVAKRVAPQISESKADKYIRDALGPRRRGQRKRPSMAELEANAVT